MMIRISQVLTAIFVCGFIIADAQIQLFDDKSVIVGNRATPISNTYFHGISQSKPVGFRLQSDFRSSTGRNQWGLYNYTYGLTNQHVFSNQNVVVGSNRISYGIYHTDYSHSSLYKFGITAYLRGTANYSQGARILNYSSNARSKIGLYIAGVQDGAGTSFGVHNVQTVRRGNAYSINNHLVINNHGAFRNEINNIYLNTGSENSNVIGSYNRIYKYPWVNRTRHVIGVYSNISGMNGYAGYFIGDVYIRGALRIASDSRIKENVRSLDQDFDALSIIGQLQPKIYNTRTVEGDVTDELNFGFIAEEVRNTVPSLVESVQQPGETEEITASPLDTVFHEDGTFTVLDSVRTESQIINGENLLSVKYTELIPILVSAVQQQEERSQDQFAELVASLDSIQEFDTSDGSVVNSEELNVVMADLSLMEQKLRDLQNAMIDWTNCYDCEQPNDGDGKESEVKRLDDVIDEGTRTMKIDDTTDMVYNRAKQIIKISSTTKSEKAILILDEFGKTLTPFSNVKKEHTINYSSWPDGIYKLKILSEGDLSKEQSIVFIKD
jgi:hypothetical protein